MLRQRSLEVMDRTCTRPPYALHVGLGAFQTIGYPPNWLDFRVRSTTWRRCRRLAKIAL